MNPKRILILGGTGFVGQHLISRLLGDGHTLVIPSRRPQRHRGLLPQPAANGNYTRPALELVEADIHDLDTLARLLEGCDAAINLVGILNERGFDGSGFARAHVDLAGRLIAACQQTGVGRLLHMSALNAGGGESHYLRTKGEAEEMVHAAEDLDVTSFRPSVIFGEGDSFFNRFASLLRVSPIAFPVACPEARFAPVFVGDVVESFAHSLGMNATIGERYELCGPHEYTFRELVEYTAELIGARRLLIDLPDFATRLQARIMERLPGKPFSWDNYLSLQVPSVCGGPFPEIFGIQPASVESIVPGYLCGKTARGAYRDYRMAARR